MRRAIKISLKFITDSKRQKISTLLESYRSAVNFYIKSLWNKKGKLDKETLSRLQNTRLSERYKSQALKQSIDIVTSTRKAAKLKHKKVNVPVFRGGAILDSKFVTIEQGKGTFDLMIKLSTLKKGSRIWLPCKKTSIFNKWISRPCSKIIQGCELREDYIVVWVNIPDFPQKESGKIIGVDIGINISGAISSAVAYVLSISK